MAENIKIITDKQDIVAIADAVRNKLGTTAEMSLGGIVSGINSISSSRNICYVGTTIPDASVGADGDIYIVKG